MFDDFRRRRRRSVTGGVLTADIAVSPEVLAICRLGLDLRGLTVACGLDSRHGRYGGRTVVFSVLTV